MAVPRLRKLTVRASLLVFIGLIYYFIRRQSSGEPPSNTVAKYEIEEVFLESWDSYVNNAWGYDVFRAYHGTGHNVDHEKPIGWMIIDSLDTMMIMYNNTESEDHKVRFRKHIQKCEDWIRDELDFDVNKYVSVFETTIRILGGLLSAYYLSGEIGVGDPEVYLTQAIDLGNRLALGFNTATGIPYAAVNLHTGAGITSLVSTAEFTTLQMEFKYLTYITGNKTYWHLAENVYKPLFKVNEFPSQWDGLVPLTANPYTGTFSGRVISLGSKGDSFYEYLLKQYLLTREKLYLHLYNISMKGVQKHLVDRLGENGYLYIGELQRGFRWPLSGKMDHLVCFMGGAYAMAATEGFPIEEAQKQPWWNDDREYYWTMGQELTRTCYKMYEEIPSGLAPEIVVFRQSVEEEHEDWWESPSGLFFVKPTDVHNLQRPETVESIMFMYKLSKDKKYRSWAWNIFQSFRKHGAYNEEDGSRSYTSIVNVLEEEVEHLDNMESFWLAETLKYLYLTYVEDFSLTNIVFNTEAHPIPVFKQSRLKQLNLKTDIAIH
ncbi:HGL239Wp [Eremothecium sinecaudum]|uniref:alpha-1,2-Mannosidase n=1 Tax=Eremothecium sinecaudum TaxID=45286 RepID=A0A0X8HV58_9SACH|nr:HGL239Wp [Eremothecium sinecaudum]AMD22101.1 HGL239Wp [Eremothecium sinecaudum]